MNKKYKLTDETMIRTGITLHRIECVEAFGNIKIGDKGGWIEKESNLSQNGDAWIYDDAKVYGYALVYGNAKVSGNAEVNGNAKVYGNAKVSGNAYVGGNAIVYGNADVSGNAFVYNDTMVCGDVTIKDTAKICGYAHVLDDAKIFGNVCVCDYAYVCGDAKIESMEDYMVFKNNWSSGRHFTWTRSNNMWKVGCFYGTGEELIKKAYKDSTKKGDCYKATVEYVENIIKITTI